MARRGEADPAQLAGRALALVEGTARGDPDAIALHVDAFDTVEEAAAAFAYLGGYLLTALAQARAEDVESTATWLRSTLEDRL